MMTKLSVSLEIIGGSPVVRWCRDIPLIWIIVVQGPTALAIGPGGGVWTFFLSSTLFSLLSASLLETARYKLIFSQRAVELKTTNQPEIISTKAN